MHSPTVHQPVDSRILVPTAAETTVLEISDALLADVHY
jgi:hypothetical protein